MKTVNMQNVYLEKPMNDLTVFAYAIKSSQEDYLHLIVFFKYPLLQRSW
jgi:hypothetical protein